MKLKALLDRSDERADFGDVLLAGLKNEQDFYINNLGWICLVNLFGSTIGRQYLREY